MATKEDRPRVFADLTVGNIPLGRIVYELFTEVAPKTADNFRSLCTGEAGIGKTTEKPLHYKGCLFHRVVKNFMIQGGDFVNFNGTGGESIYGGTFEDEEFILKHDRPYLLSMANRGKNTNGSQFFVTTAPAPHLDNLHVVFGQVVSGKEVIKEIEELDTDKKDRPLQDVRMVNCGELMKKTKKKREKSSSGSSGENSSSSDSDSGNSSSSSESEDEKKKRRRKKQKKKDKKKLKKKAKKAKKAKKSKKSKSEPPEEGELISEPHPLVSLSNIKADEIPDDPGNRFLSRDQRDRDSNSDRRESSEKRGGRNSNRRDQRDDYSRSSHKDRKKIKGRGRLTYRPDRSRSRSQTPPHWRAEKRKTISLDEYEKLKVEKAKKMDEIERRAEDRRRRHEESERKMKEKQLEDELMKKRDAERKEKEEQQRMLEAELAKERERIRQLQQEQLKQKFDYEKLDFEGEDNKSPSPPPASNAKRGSKRGHSSSPSPIKETGRKSRSRSPRSQTRNTEYRRNTGNGNSKAGSGGKTGSSGRKRRDSTSSSSSDSSESDRSSSRHHRRRRRSVSQSPRDHRRR